LIEALDSDPDIDRDDVVIFRHNLDFFFFPLLALFVLFIFYYLISKKRKKPEEIFFSPSETA
jgi:mannose/fructose/N-acetylgalactosamine-specific phosphotransferase system component IID